MVIVAMFVITKNSTMKALFKVTMSMMTTMHTCVPFSTLHFVCIQVFFGLYSVAASSSIRLYDHVLVSGVMPFFRSSYVIVPFHCYSVNFFLSDCVYPCSCMRTWCCSSSTESK